MFQNTTLFLFISKSVDVTKEQNEYSIFIECYCKINLY